MFTIHVERYSSCKFLNEQEIHVILDITLTVALPDLSLGGGGGRGGGRGRGPRRPKYLKFQAFFHNNLQNHMLAPPWQVASPPRGNCAAASGSTLALGTLFLFSFIIHCNYVNLLI